MLQVALKWNTRLRDVIWDKLLVTDVFLKVIYILFSTYPRQKKVMIALLMANIDGQVTSIRGDCSLAYFVLLHIFIELKKDNRQQIQCMKYKWYLTTHIYPPPPKKKKKKKKL